MSAQAPEILTSGIMLGVVRLTSPILVGRDEELARLRSAWSAAGQGQPSLVLVGGDAGIGKTRLVDEIVRHAREDGGRVLVGGCIEVGDGGVAFGALTDALRGLAADEEASRLPELLGPARRQLARLVPSLGGGDVFEGEPPSPIVVLQATLDALARLSGEAPVLFVLEDIHWADRSTLDLLGYLARTVRDERLLIVATYRTDELHRRHQLRPFLAELSRTRPIERVDLVPFDRPQLEAQLRAIRDGDLPARLVDEVWRRSDGNPFLAEELLAAQREGGAGTLSASLRDILDARVAGLPPTSRRVLDVAATIGRTAHHELLTAVGADVAEDLRDGLRAAVDHQILVPEPNGLYRFRHALVQEAVHDELLPGDRIELHRTVAEVLRDRPALASGGPEYVDAELAHHWEQAGDRTSAYNAAIRAGEHAQGLPAFPEALNHYERALVLRKQLPDGEVPDTLTLEELLVRVVACAVGVGDFRRAVAHQQALLETISDDRIEERAAALHRLAHVQWMAGEGREARASIARARELVADRPPTAEQARVLAYDARLSFLQGRFDEGLEPAREAVRIAEEVAHDASRSWALNSLGLLTWSLGDDAAGLEYIRASLEAARAADDVDLIGIAYNNLISISSRSVDPASLASLRREIEGWLERYEDYAGSAYVMANLAEVATAQGDVEAAADLLDRVARHRLDGAYRMNYLATAVWLATLQDDFDHAEELTEELRVVAAGMPDPQTWVPLLEGAALRALLREEPRRALELVGEAEGRTEDLPKPAPFVMPLFLKVWALTDLALAGDDGAGRQVDPAVRELEEFAAGRSRGTTFAGLVELAVAMRTRLGDPSPERWRAAAELLVLPWSRSLAMLFEVEALLELDRRAEAAQRLEETYDLSKDSGVGFVRRRAADLARRARLDLDLPELAPTPDDLGLTPREREVLGLVAEGRTNREIGEQLFITEKTASVHVSNILGKLGVDNRVEAAATAHRFGLTERGAN